jgi:hypothetical protein
VLDAALASRRSDAAAPAPVLRPFRWLPDPGLELLLSSGGRLAGEPRGLVAPGPGRVTDNDASRPASSPARPARRLSLRDRDALARLRAAGAPELGDDFTAADLRRAWRRLARLWHPDVTVGPSAAQANRAFADLAAAYRQLSCGVRSETVSSAD